MTAGDQVRLVRQGHGIYVENGGDEVLGHIEAKLASRILTFMEGGNTYAAAITAIDDRGMRIIVREMTQGADMVGRISFPPKVGEGAFRPYIKESVLRHDREDDEELTEDGEYVGESESEPEDVLEGDFYEEEQGEIE